MCSRSRLQTGVASIGVTNSPEGRMSEKTEQSAGGAYQQDRGIKSKIGEKVGG